jgi:hypothetical protein
MIISLVIIIREMYYDYGLKYLRIYDTIKSAGKSVRDLILFFFVNLKLNRQRRGCNCLRKTPTR